MEYNLKQDLIRFIDTCKAEKKYRRTPTVISTMLKQDVITVQILEDRLRQMKTGKEHMYWLLMEFYDFCRNRDIVIDTDLDQRIVVDDPKERRIAILVYMQNHMCTTSQLADVFMLDERTIRNDLLLLEQGIPVKAEIRHEGWKHFMDPSMHPIFLTLDLNEIIAMTVGLIQCADSHPLFQQQYLSIAKNVYSQLSDYAKGRIAHLIETDDIQDYFLKDMTDQYRRKISDAIITMAKRDIPGRILVHANGKDAVYNNCHILDYESDIRILTDSNQTVTLTFDSIVSCQYDEKLMAN